MASVKSNSAWRALTNHQREMAGIHMRDLFKKDSNRFQRFSLRFEEILFDYSKNRVTDKTMSLLLKLAQQARLRNRTKAMFEGAKINNTEDRAVLHVALRNRSNSPIRVDGKNVMPKVNRVLKKMETFSELVRSGRQKGYTGKTFTDIVNIGIGGSDLGPKMVTQALTPYARQGLRAHFVSNVDGSDLAEVLKKVHPERTLFLVASKTFTTQETMRNAKSAGIGSCGKQ